MNDPTLVQITAPEAPADGGDWSVRLGRLRDLVRPLAGAVVAYSGGVDSSLVLKVAVEELGMRGLGVIGRSDSYAERELRLALDQARSFGAEVLVVTTGELADANFRSNPLDRCYFCKSELYRKLEAIARRRGAEVILDGTIADDLHDHRPGRRAAAERQVRSPLAELGFTKADVRAAAASLGLRSSAKPASPCLASRIPYGTEITAEILKRVERAEDVLLERGFRVVRVRHHGPMARIEVGRDELPRLLEPGLRERVVEEIRALGYALVTVDREGFRSGSLNPAPAAAGREDAAAGLGKKGEPLARAHG